MRTYMLIAALAPRTLALRVPPTLGGEWAGWKNFGFTSSSAVGTHEPSAFLHAQGGDRPQ